ncbi:NAD(P)-binding Rossmann-fold superfamily protein [Rhynchospora pubera]|uniref:NAD(P)-binding Rossmann-fold superfamily protein n=1 Tax=Rhynchospora pubera TaxID=906938 RepID=A0AAV8HCD0_9POAL|nr:NAD(P)-binding Rossmann-fold superfamily protein [Rhynchospora pubera]
MNTSSAKDQCSPAKRWWSKETVAVVTGANKGIGFAIVKKLAELGLTVILTARDPEKGQKAVESLRVEGINVWFKRLDVADISSITDFASWLHQVFGGLDILVNNAAVSFNELNTNTVEHAETVIKTNFYGPKLLIEALMPLFRRSSSTSRILSLSSRLGLLNKLTNPAIRKLLLEEETLKEEKIDQIVKQFLIQVKDGTWQEHGWPKVWTDYSVSKLALNAYSRVLARRLEGNGVSVNCFCPGFTRTDMTGGWGQRSADEAAAAAAALALLPSEELPTGKFFKWCIPMLYSKL